MLLRRWSGGFQITAKEEGWELHRRRSRSFRRRSGSLPRWPSGWDMAKRFTKPIKSELSVWKETEPDKT